MKKATCPICFAVTRVEHYQKHRDWHRTMVNRAPDEMPDRHNPADDIELDFDEDERPGYELLGFVGGMRTVNGFLELDIWLNADGTEKFHLNMSTFTISGIVKKDV